MTDWRRITSTHTKGHPISMPHLPTAFHSYGSSPEFQGRQWSSFVGIVTAIVGNILISFALNIQRYAHIRIDREHRDRQDPEARHARKQLPKTLRNYGAAVQQEEAAEERRRINESAPVPADLNGGYDANEDARPNGIQQSLDDSVTIDGGEEHGEEDHVEEGKHARKSYLKSPWWWFGIVMMTVGETGNFLAYGFAPASIVSPLGVVALISNCLIAPLMLKERFRQRDLWGVLIAIAGAVTVVLSAKTSEKKLDPIGLWDDIKRWEFLAYVLITAIAIGALMCASPKYGQRSILVDLGLVGLFGSYTVLSTKGVASLLSASLYRAFGYPIFYVLVLVLVFSAVMQIGYLNRALQNFDSTQVIPVQFVMFTLSAIIGSAVLYRDFERTDADHVLKFIFGCLLTFSGVYLITSGRKNDDDDHGDGDGRDEPQIRLLDEESVDESTSLIKQERDLRHDTKFDGPQTPARRSDTSLPDLAVPTTVLTPAAVSSESLTKNPWISSTDSLTRAEGRPHTPRNQTLPSGSSSQTPFYTPNTTLLTVDRIGRTNSLPAHPETPTRQATPSLKPQLEAAAVTPSGLPSRTSISRLLPGPILQPLSSSLSGIVADRIMKGEGTPSPQRMSLRRNRSNREASGGRPGGLRLNTTGTSDLEAGPASAFAAQTAVEQASRNLYEASPLMLRRGNTLGEEELAATGSLRRTKGRLRSMSETLSSFMEGMTGRSGDRNTDEPPLDQSLTNR